MILPQNWITKVEIKIQFSRYFIFFANTFLINA